jgi:hypothetical protein
LLIEKLDQQAEQTEFNLHIFVIDDGSTEPLEPGCLSGGRRALAEIQLVRLVQKRGMSAEAARQRIDAQPAQEDKLVEADVIIYTDGSFERVWHQVVTAWQSTVPGQVA